MMRSCQPTLCLLVNLVDLRLSELLIFLYILVGHAHAEIHDFKNVILLAVTHNGNVTFVKLHGTITEHVYYIAFGHLFNSRWLIVHYSCAHQFLTSPMKIHLILYNRDHIRLRSVGAH